MELDHLRTLLAAIDTGSFEAAARRLRVTPSAVSQRIKALEQQVGAVLLQRSKPVRPTETGLAITRLARQVDALEREALAALHPGDDGWVSVPLVINADSLATWVLPALAAVEGVGFDIRLEDQDHSTALLRLGTVMGAVTSDPEPVQGCTVTRLGGMRYLAMASPAFRDRWMPAGPTPDALATAPRRRIQPGRRSAAPLPPVAHPTRARAADALRSVVDRVHRGGRARARLGGTARGAGAGACRGWASGCARPGASGGRAALLAAVVTRLAGALGGRAGAGGGRPATRRSLRLSKRPFEVAPSRTSGNGYGRKPPRNSTVAEALEAALRGGPFENLRDRLRQEAAPQLDGR